MTDRPRPMAASSLEAPSRRSFLACVALAPGLVASACSAPEGGPDGGPGPADGGACRPTGADVIGPYHLPGAPSRSVLTTPEEPGDRLLLSGSVFGPDCRTALPGALLDVWQADADGNYHDDRSTYRLRGQMMTDSQGRFALETIRPGRYPLGGSTRPAHIHFIVTHPDHRPLTTQLYFKGDPFLAPDDPCGECNSGDPSLIVELRPRNGGGPRAWQGTFDIVLRRA